MKKLVIIALLIFLAACTSKVYEEEQPAVQEPAVQNETPEEEPVYVPGEPEFRMISHYGVRNPPSINGSLINVGKGTGDVKITVKLYYAQVISSEKTEIIKGISPKETIKFGIALDKITQWEGYTITAEKAS